MSDSKANPPFASADGKPVSPTGGGASGGHDFTSDSKTGSASGGGRDFTKESRPQSEARPEVAPNAQSIPAGGKLLQANPGPVSSKVSGTADHVERKPFKGM